MLTQCQEENGVATARANASRDTRDETDTETETKTGGCAHFADRLAESAVMKTENEANREKVGFGILNC
jgi:hypothetical protein